MRGWKRGDCRNRGVTVRITSKEEMAVGLWIAGELSVLVVLEISDQKLPRTPSRTAMAARMLSGHRRRNETVWTIQWQFKRKLWL